MSVSFGADGPTLASTPRTTTINPTRLSPDREESFYTCQCVRRQSATAKNLAPDNIMWQRFILSSIKSLATRSIHKHRCYRLGPNTLAVWCIAPPSHRSPRRISLTRRNSYSYNSLCSWNDLLCTEDRNMSSVFLKIKISSI